MVHAEEKEVQTNYYYMFGTSRVMCTVGGGGGGRGAGVSKCLTHNANRCVCIRIKH